MLRLVALESCLSWVGNLELLQTTGTQGQGCFILGQGRRGDGETRGRGDFSLNNLNFSPIYPTLFFDCLMNR